ncbi:MAG: GMP synthase (glutamine-hydrolyzing) [bacterium ADurb.Bin374]|nr:MAG: GMP synthase (glutamine-hydrolyzing) [bacterium ADurb.Bin374]
MPDVWQMPVVSLPLLDDTGKPIFVIRPVTSENAMTADFFRMDPGQLSQLTSQIEHLDDAGMLLYDVTPKPPATIEWE